ncbi:hypothetical protein [Actinoplanes sp. NPDC051494]|uniref:hypothetical protein n=1 Tax=Actinoplanes sp. NPDC051494 TaxID=3363907 RepID=UPI0037B39C82
MRRRPSLFLLALVTAGLALVSPGQAAHAAPLTVKMVVAATPQPVLKGAEVTLSGRVWVGATGNRARIDFYFHPTGTPANEYAYRGFTTANDAGTFARRFVASTTGTWKAVFPGSVTRRNAARLRAVQVVQPRSKEIVSYGPASGDWKGRPLLIPTARYTAIVTYRCMGSGPLFVVWHGDDMGESAGHIGPEGTVTMHGLAGGRHGFFEIITEPACTWRLRIFSGIALVPA